METFGDSYDDIARNMKAVEVAMRSAAKPAVVKTAASIRAKGRPRTPLDTDDLRDSVREITVEQTADGVEREIAYDIEYARDQETREDFRHRYGQAHFLQQTVDEHGDVLLRNLAAESRKVFR